MGFRLRMKGRRENGGVRGLIHYYIGVGGALEPLSIEVGEPLLLMLTTEGVSAYKMKWLEGVKSVGDVELLCEELDRRRMVGIEESTWSEGDVVLMEEEEEE